MKYTGVVWALGVGGSIANSMSYTSLSTKQRLFHARVHSQAITVLRQLSRGLPALTLLRRQQLLRRQHCLPAPIYASAPTLPLGTITSIQHQV